MRLQPGIGPMTFVIVFISLTAKDNCFILLNNGKGKFTWIAPEQSGLRINGEVRDIQFVMINNKRSFLFLQNDEYPLLYQVKNSVKAVKKN